MVAAEFGGGGVGSSRVATASMDATARCYDTETGQQTHTLAAHAAEVIAARLSRDAQQLLTASFDGTARVWDLRASCSGAAAALAPGAVHELRGHEAELSSCVWNFDNMLIASGSLDGSARVWDLRRPTEAWQTLLGHRSDAEVLDVCFDAAGRRLATAGSDGTAIVWCTKLAAGDHRTATEATGGRQLARMRGHRDEVSRVCFNAAGNLLLSASADRTACLWCTRTGRMAQMLGGHTQEVFGGAFSYAGDAVVTVSKDNTCRVWR